MRAFTLVDVPQRSAEWHQARVGRLTGSRAGDMLARIKTGEAAARRDLRAQLVCERLTNQPQEDGFISREMQRGIDREDDARRAYEARTGSIVRASGFLAHRTLMAGCSLDGYLGDFAGILELKCPKSATHLRYLHCTGVPSEHVPQVMHNLWMTGAAYADFVSFDDRFPPGLQLVIRRLGRTALDIATYESEATTFLAEVARDVEALATMQSIRTQLDAALAVA